LLPFSGELVLKYVLLEVEEKHGYEKIKDKSLNTMR